MKTLNYNLNSDSNYSNNAPQYNACEQADCALTIPSSNDF